MLSKELKVALKAAEQKSDPDLWVQSCYFCWSCSRALEARPLALAFKKLPWTRPDSPHFRVPGDLPSGIPVLSPPSSAQAVLATSVGMLPSASPPKPTQPLARLPSQWSPDPSEKSVSSPRPWSLAAAIPVCQLAVNSPTPGLFRAGTEDCG